MNVVIISQQGSGTNLLRSFLNSHPDIEIYAEIFCDRYDGEAKYRGRTSKADHLVNFFKNRETKVKGFDLKYNQLDNELLKALDVSDIKIIHFYRNSGRTFLRHINEDSKPFTYEQIREHCDFVEDKRNLVNQIFQDVEIFYYEDMTRGKKISSLPREFELDLQEALNVSAKFLKPKPTKHALKELKIRY